MPKITVVYVQDTFNRTCLQVRKKRQDESKKESLRKPRCRDNILSCNRALTEGPQHSSNSSNNHFRDSEGVEIENFLDRKKETYLIIPHPSTPTKVWPRFKKQLGLKIARRKKDFPTNFGCSCLLC